VSKRIGSIAKRRLEVGRRQPGIRLQQHLFVRPSASLRTISSIGIRVPRITALPNMILGLISTRSWTVIVDSFLPEPR